VTKAYPSKAKWIARPWATVFLRYGLALVSVTVAQALAHTFLYFHLPQPLTLFALSAIAITFRYAGTMPGILAALLSALLRGYVFEPRITAESRLLYDLGFLIFAVLMVRFTGERKRREARVAERSAELTRANEDLKLEIAERKQSEDHFRQVLDTTPALIHSARPDGYVDYFNQRWLNYVGLPLEDLQGWGWTKVIHPEDLAVIVEKWRTSLANGKPFVYETRMRRADGQYRCQLFRKVPLRDTHDRIVKWYGSAIDIEDRKRVEEALTASEQEHRRIAEQLERERARLIEAQEVGKIGSWEAELPSLNVVWSEQTHRIFETDPSRFRPTRPKFREFIHPDDRAKVDTAFKMSLGKLSPCTVEYRIVMPDGRLKFIEERWRAFLDKQGKPVRVAGTCRDTTERVRAEEERRHLSGKLLRSRDEERRRIARDLHDDLGQDLFAALLALAQLSRGIPNERKQKLLSETREIIHACAEKVRTLAHLLSPPELERLGLKTAIVVYVDGFRERSRTQIDIEIPAGLPKLPLPIETALFKMTQECLLNIQRHAKSSEAQIRIESTPRQITLEVRDEGVGMQPAGSGVAEGSQPRFGVGLTGMSERIEELGGRLEITSGSWGTSVKATLPLVLSKLESES